MATILKPSTIAALWQALNSQSRPPKLSHGKKLFEQIASAGWAKRPDIEDIFYLYDDRIDHSVDIEELCSAFRLPMREIAYLPKSRTSNVSLTKALSAADLAEFLIEMERLGFLVDPSNLVKLLIPKIVQQKRITNSELSVLWFDRTRHKTAPLTIQVANTVFGAHQQKKLTTSAGYKIELWLSVAGEPMWLTVSAPKYRRRQNPKSVICAVCGHNWYKGNPDSSAEHRKIHKDRLKVLDPQPNERMLRAQKTEVEPELVSWTSPIWKHKEIYERARFFRREFGFDFVQWGSSKGDDDPNAHGFLFTDNVGRIVGACAFRLRQFDTKSRWGLQWVWVAPFARRSGVLSSRWSMFRERFGDFDVESPVSDAMMAFLAKNTGSGRPK